MKHQNNHVYNVKKFHKTHNVTSMNSQQLRPENVSVLSGFTHIMMVPPKVRTQTFIVCNDASVKSRTQTAKLWKGGGAKV